MFCCILGSTKSQNVTLTIADPIEPKITANKAEQTLLKGCDTMLSDTNATI
jgi:hypothetical protein